SVATGAGRFRRDVHPPAAAFTAWCAGHVLVGWVQSPTVTRIKSRWSLSFCDAPPCAVSALRLVPAAFFTRIRNCFPSNALLKLKVALMVVLFRTLKLVA